MRVVATNKEAKDRVNIPTTENKEVTQGMGGMTENKEKRRRRIYGHVESETLWKLKNCLVGETANVCSIESVHARLLEWGMGDVKEIEASLKTCNLGIHPNHEKEDIAMGNVSSLEDRGEVGVGHKMLADDINKLNEKIRGQNVVNQKNSEINWAKHLFKNIRAQVEGGEIRTSEACLENPVGKDPSALVVGECEIEEMNLISNPGQTLDIGNDPNEALEGQNVIVDRSLEEKRDRCSPIRNANEEAHQIEQGEDGPFSSSDREENWSKAERVFFPEIVLKKPTKKRYGSLKQIQDKSISEKERKRRDRVICREKQFAKGEEESELSGRSLTESNMINHKETLLKRAKRTLALGKRLVVDIEGNKVGALNEIHDPGGDFNVVRHKGERSGCREVTTGRVCSDHSPIMLHTEEMNWGPKPFKFINGWLQNEKCREIISECFRPEIRIGGIGFKLKKLKGRLRRWNEKDSVNYGRKIREFESKINKLEEDGNDGDVDISRLNVLKDLKLELWETSKLQEDLFRQQARVRWLLVATVIASESIVNASTSSTQMLRYNGSCLSRNLGGGGNQISAERLAVLLAYP
ncbi:hypothetical protein GQ457_02G032030 [Hibiscus cannabinus]